MKAGRASNPRVMYLGQGGRKVLADAPLGIMRPQLGQIGDVADVITVSARTYIFVLHRFARNFAYGLERLQDRNRVLSSAPDVVNFCRAGSRDEAFDEPSDIEAMDVIANLLSLVTENTVRAPFKVALYQITQETVELDSAVIWPRQTSAAQTTRGHSEVPSIFLHHNVCSHLGCAKQ